MSTGEFQCHRCGKCCKESWEIPVDFHRDVLRWIEERRFDILKRVVLSPRFVLNPERYGNNPHWIIDCGHVLFGDITFKCPFLDEVRNSEPAGCAIHETRPYACRLFPYNENGVVRTDILDLCMGTIFYHSAEAEKNGLGLVDYLNRININGSERFQKISGTEELRNIASLYRDRQLKIRLTSSQGVRIAEEAISLK